MDKYEMINNFSGDEFGMFLRNDYSGQVLDLFDDEGINLLMKKESPYAEDIICYIILYSPYKEKLLNNDHFLEVMLSKNITWYYAVLKRLSSVVCDKVLEKAFELGLDGEIDKLFCNFNEEYQLNALENWKYSSDILYNILNASGFVSVIQKIIDKYNIDLSSDKINLKNFFDKAKMSVGRTIKERNENGIEIPCINIPSSMITRELCEKIWSKNDIFFSRAIVNEMQFSTDVSYVNEYFKKREDNIISSINDYSLLFPYNEIYNVLSNISDDSNYEEYSNGMNKFRKALRCINNKHEYDEIYRLFREEDTSNLLEYLKVLSDRMISNYIIDYHFEENFHNIMIDTRELLRMYYDGHITLPNDRIELYEKIANVDYLSIDEKKELHEILKSISMKDIFYDDMAYARRIVNEAIKEYSLDSQSLLKYRSDKLSNEYGVDVYEIGDETFFGIVKSGIHVADTLPTGHSYSLVGTGGVAVYGSFDGSNTFLYDAADLNPDQIVHTYPYDSFTLYKPFSLNESSTQTVHTLLMPEELVNTSENAYTEVLILENGTKETDIDDKIPRLKSIALYCIDQITEQDVARAKQSGVGIILVNSKKYMEDRERYQGKFLGEDNHFRYVYFNGVSDSESFEAKR